MLETASTGPVPRTVGQRTDVRQGSVRALAERDFSAAYGRAPQRKQLDALARFGELIGFWLRRERGGDVVTVHRSFPQIFRALDLPVTGNIRSDRQRYRNNVANRLNYLKEMGWIDDWRVAPPKPNGEGTGIVVALRRDSSVGRAHHARRVRRGALAGSAPPPRRPGGPSLTSASAEPPGRPFSCGTFASPLRENCVPEGADGDVVPSRHPSVHGKRNCRRATRTRGQRSGHQVTASAIRSLSEAGQEAGAELISRLPWLCDLQPAVLLRAAVIAERHNDGWQLESVALSEQSRLIVEAAYDELDRLDGRGAGAAAIIDLARGGWRHHRLPSRRGELEAPRTPGALAKPLRQRARMARRAAQLRSGAL